MYQQKCQEMDETPIGWTLLNNGLMSANFHQLKEMGGLIATVVQRARAENFGNLNELTERIELHTVHCLQKKMRANAQFLV